MFIFSSNKLGLAFWLIVVPLVLILIPVLLFIGIVVTTVKILGGFKVKSINLPPQNNDRLTLKDVN